MHEISQPDQFYPPFGLNEMTPNVLPASSFMYGHAGDELISEPAPKQAEIKMPSESIPAMAEAQPETTTPAETTQPSTVYPRYTYEVRGNTEPVDMERIGNDFRDHLQKNRDETNFPSEKPLTDDEWADIQREHEGIVAMGDELGVDLRERLPRRQDYHMFDSQEAFSQDLSPIVGEEATTNRGLQRSEIGVMWVRQEDQALNSTGLVHETTHDVSAYKILFNVQSETVDEKGDVDRNVDVGYIPAYEGILNEVATEMLTTRAMNNVGHDRINFSYGPSDAIVDAMIHEAAEHHGKPVQEIADLFMRGALTGEQEGLSLMQTAVGKERMNQFMQAATDDMDTGEELARSLKLPRAVAAMQRAREGKSAEIFHWD